jgi:hypothetical protein
MLLAIHERLNHPYEDIFRFYPKRGSNATINVVTCRFGGAQVTPGRNLIPFRYYQKFTWKRCMQSCQRRAKLSASAPVYTLYPLWRFDSAQVHLFAHRLYTATIACLQFTRRCKFQKEAWFSIRSPASEHHISIPDIKR